VIAFFFKSWSLLKNKYYMSKQVQQIVRF
jgi:hypothetical protein